MFEMPRPYPYPKISDISKRPELNGIFCYIIQSYKPGISVVIKLRKDEIGTTVADWDGNPMQKFDAGKVLGEIMPKMAAIMRTIGLAQAQFFLASDFSIADVQLGDSKFMSPGMVRDLFKVQLSVPVIDEISILTPEKINDLRTAGRKVIIKPSRFRTVSVIPNLAMPCYATIG